MSSTFYVFNGDIYLAEDSGRSYLVDGVDKCSQDIMESFYTDYDPERNIGSEISDIYSLPIMGKGVMTSFIKSKVADVIERLQLYQQVDPYITADEKIKDILTLQVQQLNNTTYVFYIKVSVEDPTTNVTSILPIIVNNTTLLDIDNYLVALEQSIQGE